MNTLTKILYSIFAVFVCHTYAFGAEERCGKLFTKLDTADDTGKALRIRLGKNATVGDENDFACTSSKNERVKFEGFTYGCVKYGSVQKLDLYDCAVVAGSQACSGTNEYYTGDGCKKCATGSCVYMTPSKEFHTTTSCPDCPKGYYNENGTCTACPGVDTVDGITSNNNLNVTTSYQCGKKQYQGNAYTPAKSSCYLEGDATDKTGTFKIVDNVVNKCNWKN